MGHHLPPLGKGRQAAQHTVGSERTRSLTRILPVQVAQTIKQAPPPCPYCRPDANHPSCTLPYVYSTLHVHYSLRRALSYPMLSRYNYSLKRSFLEYMVLEFPVDYVTPPVTIYKVICRWSDICQLQSTKYYSVLLRVCEWSHSYDRVPYVLCALTSERERRERMNDHSGR